MALLNKIRSLDLFQSEFSILAQYLLNFLMTLGSESLYGGTPQAGGSSVWGKSRELILQKLRNPSGVLDGLLKGDRAGSLTDRTRLEDYWMQYLPGPYSLACDGIYGWAATVIRLALTEVEDYLDRVRELLRLYGYDQMTVSEELKLKDLYLLLAFNGVMAKEFKTSVNFIFAEYFGTDYPKESLANLGYDFFPSRLAVVLRRKARCVNKSFKVKECSIFYTLFQGLKKGLLPIRPDQVDSSLLDHKAALTKNPSISTETRRDLEDLLWGSFKGLRNVWAKSRRMPETLLSNKATVDCGMGKGGQVGFVCESDLSALEGNRPGLCQKLNVDYTVHYSLSFARDSLLGHFRSTHTCEEGLRYGPLFFAESEIREALKYYKYGRGDPLVQPAVVLEPLKGRIITKPRAGDYLGLGKLQKSLWSAIQKYPQFCLTGRPVTPEDIYKVLGDWSVGKKVNSGDFSGATDNLKGEISEMVLDFLLEESDIGAADQLLIKKSFLNSVIDYSQQPIAASPKEVSFVSLYQKWKCTLQGQVPQTNGQLMGHLLSFPILCIANYLIFRLVYKRMGRRQPKVLVNGDDILFTCYPEEYSLWCQTTAECGFFPSLGKNLFSDKIAQINSVLFKIETSLKPGSQFDYFVRSVKEVPYFNFGLLTKRGKGRTGEDQSNVQRLLNDSQRLPVVLEIRKELVDNLEPFYDRRNLEALFRAHYQRIIREFREETGLDLLDLPYCEEWRAFFSACTAKVNPWKEQARENSHIRMLATNDTLELSPFDRMRELLAPMVLRSSKRPTLDVHAFAFWYQTREIERSDFEFETYPDKDSLSFELLTRLSLWDRRQILLDR